MSISVLKNVIAGSVSARKVRVIGLAAIYLLLLFGLGIAFSVAVVNKVNRWSSLKPRYEISKSRWQALEQTQPLVETFPREEAWSQSGLAIAEGAFRKLKFQNPLWLRLDLRAGEVPFQARNFLIGRIKGKTSIWLNNEYQFTAEDSDAQPIVLPISDGKLTQTLHFVLKVEPRRDAVNLLPFVLGFPQGFYERAQLDDYLDFMDFNNKAKPFALFIAYMVLSGLFFFLWIASPIAIEHIRLAGLTAVCALPEILFSDGLHFKVSAAYVTNLFMCLALWKCALAISLGGALARLRGSERAFWITTLTLSVLLFTAPGASLDAYRVPMSKIGVPLSFLFGALLCLWQMSVLMRASISQGGTYVARKRRLLVLSLTLTTLAVADFLQFGSFFSYVTDKVLWGLPEFLLIFVLGFFALRDLFRQSKLLENTPVSVYHRRPSLPEAVAGFVVILDLKNSEALFEVKAAGGGNESLVPLVVSHLCTAFTERGGVILKAEGDEVVAFFDHDRVQDAEQQTVKAIDNCEFALVKLRKQLQDVHGLKLNPFNFRAGISHGKIRPVWLTSGGARIAAWTQVGDSMVFVECARLMEIEKQIGGTGEQSLALVKAELVERTRKGENLFLGTFLEQEKLFVGKHGKTYLVSVYSPAGEKVIPVDTKPAA